MLLDKLIWQMEMRLAEPVSLNELAALCAVSPFHMVRSFRMATGLSPMTYLRARRLSVAAAALAEGGQDILPIALAAQYNSHAAFTRAFAAYFGVSPNAVRKARSLDNLTLMEPLQMNKDMIVDIAAPEILDRAGFRVAGLNLTCRFENTSGIPALWQAFNAREDEVAAQPGPAYGVCYDADRVGHFNYLAGMEPTADHPLPADMVQVDIPAGRYAVFTHKGHIADFPKTVYTAWNIGLTDAGLTAREAPNFELYDGRFDAGTGRGEVELWLPVI